MTTTTTYNNTTTEALVRWTQAQPERECRRWSYEIEAVNLGRASSELQDLGYETHNDPSVDTDEGDCECYCEECSHRCNCPSCEVAEYGEFDHCGGSDCYNNDTEASPEFEVRTTHDSEHLPHATKALREAGAYTNDDCGGHVHVDARDLTRAQVANLMRAWRVVAEKLPDLIGRGYNRFAKDMTDGFEIETVQRGTDGADRYSAVNPTNLQALWRGHTNYTKTTVEFRQFAGTIDPALIVARGYLCRALVEHVATNQPIYWLTRCTTAEQLLTELGLGLIRESETEEDHSSL